MKAPAKLTSEEEDFAEDFFIELREAFESEISRVISEHEAFDPAFHRSLTAAVRTAGMLDDERIQELMSSAAIDAKELMSMAADDDKQ